MSLTFLATASAFAAEAYVTNSVNLRAGPDPSYPTVARLHRGTSVQIEGCVDGWSWCDVATGDDRGWMAGNYLQEEYEGRRVLVPSYGVQIGIPIVAFVFGTYWDDHYRSRSWYGGRERWSHVNPQYRSTGIRTDAHHGSDHSSYNTGHNASNVSSSPAYRAPDRSVHSGTAASTRHPSYGSRASDTEAPHHSAATQVRSPDNHPSHSKPVEHNVPQSRVESRHAADHSAAHAKAGNEHGPAPARAEPKQDREKPAHDHGGGKEKDQH